MTNFLRDLISVSIVLGIMIFVHEWGHFIAAKLCGVRVDVFSFGFGPRLFGVKRGDTDYRLSALPFGGYVRMAGDNVVEERTGADYEYLSKPRWQRVLIAIAGPAMNILLAFLIFWGIYWLVGVPYETDLRQPADVVAVPATPADHLGVEPGDRIIAIDGEKTPTWEKVLSRVEQSRARRTLSVTVAARRRGADFQGPYPQDRLSADSIVGYPNLPPSSTMSRSVSRRKKRASRSGDLIVSINGKPVTTWYQLVDAVHASGGHPLDFMVRRDGQDVPLTITPIQGMGARRPERLADWRHSQNDRSFEREGLVHRRQGRHHRDLSEHAPDRAGDRRALQRQESPSANCRASLESRAFRDRPRSADP